MSFLYYNFIIFVVYVTFSIYYVCCLGDFMLPDAEPEDRVYAEIFSIEEFYKIAEQCLEEYNNTHKNRMNLVIFRYVLEHLSRMCRILRSPGELFIY